jgi:hypothetical protein
MADWQMKLIAAEAQRLVELAREDAALRRELRALAQHILAATADHENDDRGGLVNRASQSASDSAGQENVLAAPVVLADSGPADEPLRELTLGRRSTTEQSTRPDSAAINEPANRDDDIARLERSCWKKAGAARWAAERQRRLQQGYDPQVDDDDLPADPEIDEWADRLTDGFYWLNASGESRLADLTLLDDVGGCFEAVAIALDLVRVGSDNSRALEQILPLVAEAQSVLRAAIQRAGTAGDADQVEVFEWLKTAAARHRVYIKRYMRIDDAADPSRWPDLVTRLEKLEARYGPTGSRSPHESLFDGLRLRLDAVRASGPGEPDWRAVITAIDDILKAGVPPSNRTLRELLLPVINELPDIGPIPPGFRLVLREIDRFLATRPSTAESSVSDEPTPEVKAVARLLGGKKAVLIGGSRRRPAQAALERAFGLKELIWIETKEHEAVSGFEPLIARPEVALVLLAIRWSSHAFGDVKVLCDRHDKPLVRLPGGYNASQVAAQVLAQCSDRLARS